MSRLLIVAFGFCLCADASDKVGAKADCKDVAFGCPEGYECKVPEKGCSSHCSCYDPARNVTLPPGCPIRIKPCDEGHFCVPENSGDCFACNCDSKLATTGGVLLKTENKGRIARDPSGMIYAVLELTLRGDYESFIP